MRPAIVRCIGGPFDGHQVEGLVQEFRLAPSRQGDADPQPGGTYRYDREETAYRWTPERLRETSMMPGQLPGTW